MAKNFDYILTVAEHVPGFKRLHDYCDKAESFQTTFPEESANNARKALEWLVKNMLKMKDVQLSEIISRAQIPSDLVIELNIYQVYHKVPQKNTTTTVISSITISSFLNPPLCRRFLDFGSYYLPPFELSTLRAISCGSPSFFFLSFALIQGIKRRVIAVNPLK